VDGAAASNHDTLSWCDRQSNVSARALDNERGAARPAGAALEFEIVGDAASSRNRVAREAGDSVTVADIG
jgi:hypothetical protein